MRHGRARPRRALAVAFAFVLGTSALAQPSLGTPGAASGAATAAPAQVRHLLDALAGHPTLRAVDALNEAAAARVAAVGAPLSISGEANLERLDFAFLPPGTEDLGLEDPSVRYALRVLLRPFVAGELGDLADQRGLEAERARLQVRETRAGLEVQAIQAALGRWLSELAVTLAEEAVALAELADSATRRRADLGGASAIEVGRSQLALREAEAAWRDARRQRDLAGASAASLVGEARLDGPFDLDPVTGVPPDLVRAALDVALAEVGVRNGARGRSPQVQAGYSWLLDDDASVSIGIESRSFQPFVAYDSSGALRGATLPPGAELRGALSVGITWAWSPQDDLESEAQRRQLEAAVEGLAWAHERARLQHHALAATIATSATRVELSAFDLELAALERDAADARFASGAASELDRLQTHLAWRQAVLAHARARLDHVAAILDTYATYAIPPSEVLP